MILSAMPPDLMLRGSSLTIRFIVFEPCNGAR
jgi:hypothetical protein